MSENAGGSPGLNKLAGVLTKRMKEISESDMGDIEPDFGKINSDGSLSVDRFPHSFPKGDYYMGRLVSGISIGVNSSYGGSVTIPKLKSGDRVLVIWVQNEPIVVDVIKRS